MLLAIKTYLKENRNHFLSIKISAQVYSKNKFNKDAPTLNLFR